MSATLGIIGGMGPEATIDLYRKIIELTPAKKDQEHIHVIIDSYAQIPDRTSFILSNTEDPTPYIVRSAKLLEKAGADAVIMPCNTAHFFEKSIIEALNIPFISIIDSAINEIRINYPDAKNVLPIATKGAMFSKIYENKLVAAGYRVCPLSDELIKNIMSAIYDGVKKKETDKLVPLFQKTLDDIKETVRPDLIIAACTEIPILMEKVKTDIPVVDATLALAKNAVKFALAEKA